MPEHRLRVAFLWHMHQPYYRDLVTGRSALPWVRLHAVKDYWPMGRLLERHPAVRATVNFVPSLVKQILEYTDANLRDDFWDVSSIHAADLTAGQRIFLLKNFFMTNWNLVVRNIPRYAALLEKRGYNPGEKDWERAAVIFSSQDILDLQVWFNLVWFHPMDVEESSELAALFKRGKNFSEEQKAYVLSRQLEIMGRIVPLYRALMERGQVELSTSPYYHPILPLLVDTDSAREAQPGLELPSLPFRRPEDAARQLQMAVEYHRSVFGRRPEGLWPSEGSVSEGMLPLVMDAGFSWMASDEDILYRSLSPGGSERPGTEEQRCRTLYHAFRLERGGRRLAMIFRDHLLSDTLSFTYGHWDPSAAAGDLVGRLESLAGNCRRDGGGPPLVPIILDGENPWEYYRDQGYPFLRELYGKLEQSRLLRTSTVAGAVAEGTVDLGLTRLAAGSWINHNFQIWIGHAEDRRAWELLAKARHVLDGLAASSEEERLRHAKAFEEMLIAEGSDWCWWYGEENSSGNDEAFDELYRRHLRNVYALVGREVPDELKVTIFAGRRMMVPITRIYSFINPVIDGRVTSYFEWLAAGEFAIDNQGSTMHRADTILSAIYFGFNADTLFIRADPDLKTMADDIRRYAFSFHFLKPGQFRLDVGPNGEGGVSAAFAGDGPVSASSVKAAFKDVLEVAVPFATLGAKVGEPVEFFVSLAKDGLEAGHWPYQGSIRLKVPPEDFEEKIWSI